MIPGDELSHRSMASGHHTGSKLKENGGSSVFVDSVSGSTSTGRSQLSMEVALYLNGRWLASFA